MGVNIVKLGDVAIISAGQSAPKNNYFCEEGIPFIRAGSLEFLERGESIDLCEKISEENAKICKLKLYPANSILFAKSGMSANKGRIYKLKQDAYVVSHLAIVTPDETKLISEYLMYWLQKNPPKTLIKDESYPSIGLTDIANMEIELPSIEEQKRIAQVLDKADEIRQKKKQANDKLDEFLKSTFIDMFGDPVKNKKNFPLMALKNIFVLSSGDFLPASKRNDNGNYPVYGGNGITGYHDEFMFKNSKLCIGRVGVKCGCIHITKPYSWITDNALYVKEYKSNVNETWLKIVLSIMDLNQYAKQSAQPQISQTVISNLSIIFPSIGEQNKFAEIVEKVEVQKQKNEQVIEQMDNLFNALSQKAFNGEL